MAGTNNMPVVSCWLCENPTEIRFSKKDRPYLVCEECGVQTFIRYQRAEELLAERVRLEAKDG